MLLDNFYINVPWTSQTVFEVNATSSNFAFVTNSSGIGTGTHYWGYLNPGKTTVIDWGDGTNVEYWPTRYPPQHIYRSPGNYTVSIEDTLDYVSFYRDSKLSSDGLTKLVRLGDSIKTCSYLMYGRTDLAEVPENFDNSNEISSMYYAFYGCKGLRTPFAKWPANCHNTQYCFQNSGIVIPPEDFNHISCTANMVYTFTSCSNLLYPEDDWPDVIVQSLAYMYDGCTSLTRLPATWPEASKGAYNYSFMFRNCKNISTRLKKWPEFKSGTSPNVSQMYSYCLKLAGVWDDSAPDSELMPSSITSHSNTFTGASAAVRSKFLTTWGGTRSS